MPAKVTPVQTLPPIRIYESSETAFTGNGLRCLVPQSAEVTLKEQQAHSIHMVHPLDDEGAWKTIQLSRILYVPIKRRGVMTFQPLRIYKIQKQRQSGGSLSITVDAKHVFYDLNSVMVRSAQINAAACQSAIGTVFSSVYRPTANAQASDSFSYSSDISAAKSAEYANVTVTAALIGNDNSIASLYGGELFVDGFRFSINSRMEGAQDNSFNLAYGFNLIGITATYSTENTYSAVIGESNISAQPLTRTVDPATIELPFDRTIYAKFSYKAGTSAAQFETDMDKYSADNAQVNATYQVTFADLPSADEYQQFIELETHEVGDTGTVYDADLQISTVQKIIEKKLDVITQTELSVTLGSAPASITQAKPFASTVTNSMSADEKAQTVLSAAISGEHAESNLQKNAMAEIIDSSGIKNMIPSGSESGSGTQLVDIRFDIPQGEYVLYFGSLISNDTDATTCQVAAFSVSNVAVSQYLQYTRGSNQSKVLTLTGDAAFIRVYASKNTASGRNDTVTYTEAMLCKKVYWGISQKYVPPGTSQGG